MSEPTDIKALDEYLKGGSDISQRYRELGREDVPPELDRRVLAEARAAVAGEGAKRSRSWMRWSAPVALAASVVLVVTVVIESGVQDDASFANKPALAERKLDTSEPDSAGALLTEESRLEEPAQSPPFAPEPPASIAQQAASAAAPAPAPAAAPPPPSLAKAEAAEKRAYNVAPEEVRVDARAIRDRQQESALPVTAVAPPLASAEPQFAAAEQPVPSLPGSVRPVSARESVARTEAEADSADVGEVSVTGSRARRTPGRTAGPRNTISGSTLRGQIGQAADTAAQAEHPDPDKWLEEIRDLRRKGKTADADREWQLFLEAYPDFQVADDDIARKR